MPVMGGVAVGSGVSDGVGGTGVSDGIGVNVGSGVRVASGVAVKRGVRLMSGASVDVGIAALIGPPLPEQAARASIDTSIHRQSLLQVTIVFLLTSHYGQFDRRGTLVIRADLGIIIVRKGTQGKNST
jgi:hypothetical protein